MKIEQIYTGCLAQGAYYIESEGEAAIIDPLRDVSEYIDLAKRREVKIKYIFETHFHADFVSGHVTLAEKTGAKIIYGPLAETDFKSYSAQDGEVFKLGKITIKLLHTPGHTMESSCYLLKDENEKPVSLFTGDTLFLGDVGRPDLAQKSGSITSEDLAGYLYDSLRNKIMTLPDDIIIYPGHGAGSACGKNMSSDTVDTLENQKKTNYALRADMTKTEFIEEVNDGLNPPPAYFPENVRMNKSGYTATEELLGSVLNPLDASDFNAKSREDGVIIIDVRPKEDFERLHIKNSIFIGLDGDFAPWVGSVIKNIDTPILLVAESNQLEEAVIRLSRVGFDNVIGYLKGGINEWQKEGYELDQINSINAIDLSNLEIEEIKSSIIDVRKPSEYSKGHIEMVRNLPLSSIAELSEDLEKENGNYIVHCAGGYRSLIAISILKKLGFKNLTNVKGGYAAIKKTDMNLSQKVDSLNV